MYRLCHLDLSNQIVKPIDEIYYNNNLIKQLVSLVKQNYEETNLANPVAEFDLSKWEKLTFAEDLIESGSFVCLDQEEENVLAYSFLHKAEQDTVELGWCGALGEQDIGLIPILVNEQIRFSRSRGYQYLEGEFDTTSAYAMEVFNTLSLLDRPTWITYQKKECFT